MKMNFVKYYLLPICFLCVIGFSAPFLMNYGEQHTIQLLSKKYKYQAGEEIIIQFSTSNDGQYGLLLKSSYGTVYLKENSVNGRISFRLPHIISKKTGVLNYQLYADGTLQITGDLMISSAEQRTSMVEAYLGPTSINAGGLDYGMMIAMPTDVFDNPLADSTKVEVKHQFLTNEKVEELLIDNFLVWKNIYSYETSGRILVSAKEGLISSKEFTLDVFPSQAEDFQLYETRKHNYADGNQVVEFYTSTIMDKYGNTISDGRIVEIIIQNDKGGRISTIAKTIDGVARGFIIHPAEECTWNAKAYIPEMAESNGIELSFLPAVKDIGISFATHNREVMIGPITSFMEQLIPDGAIISLRLYKNGQLVDEFHKSTYNGKTKFKISKDFYPDGMYDIEIEGLGIKKVFTSHSLK